MIGLVLKTSCTKAPAREWSKGILKVWIISGLPHPHRINDQSRLCHMFRRLCSSVFPSLIWSPWSPHQLGLSSVLSMSSLSFSTAYGFIISTAIKQLSFFSILWRWRSTANDFHHHQKHSHHSLRTQSTPHFEIYSVTLNCLSLRKV